MLRRIPTRPRCSRDERPPTSTGCWPFLLLCLVSAGNASSAASAQTSDCPPLQRKLMTPSQHQALVEVVPPSAKPGDVAIVGITVVNPTNDVRRRVVADLIVPSGIESFLAGGTGGFCSNLANDCVEGARLSWSFSNVGPGELRTVALPAVIRAVTTPSAKREDIPFSVTVNWDGGGGVVGEKALRVASEDDEPGCLSSYTSVSDRQLRVEVVPNVFAVKPGLVVPVLIRVSNVTSQTIRGARLRFIVPHGVESFYAQAAAGLCANLSNNCYPGQILSWTFGSLEPGDTRGVQVPIKITGPSLSQRMLCATANAENGGSGLACSALSVR